MFHFIDPDSGDPAVIHCHYRNARGAVCAKDDTAVAVRLMGDEFIPVCVYHDVPSVGVDANFPPPRFRLRIYADSEQAEAPDRPGFPMVWALVEEGRSVTDSAILATFPTENEAREASLTGEYPDDVRLVFIADPAAGESRG